MIQGTKMEEFNKDMIEQGHHYATIDSGFNIASKSISQPFYSDIKTRNPNVISEKPLLQSI
jgi:hypothetical protein